MVILPDICVMCCETNALGVLKILSSEDQLYACGALFENHVVAETAKAYLHHRRTPPLFFWRDRTGHEIDLVIEEAGRLYSVEIKSASRCTAPPWFTVEKNATPAVEWRCGLGLRCKIGLAIRRPVMMRFFSPLVKMWFPRSAKALSPRISRLGDTACGKRDTARDQSASQITGDFLETRNGLCHVYPQTLSALRAVEHNAEEPVDAKSRRIV